MNTTKSNPLIIKLFTSVKSNLWNILFFGSIVFILFGLFSTLSQHKENIKNITVQNPTCIYLEKSDLEGDQYYMICDGQIVLKRISAENEAEPVEEKLEKALTATPAE